MNHTFNNSSLSTSTFIILIRYAAGRASSAAADVGAGGVGASASAGGAVLPSTNAMVERTRKRAARAMVTERSPTKKSKYNKVRNQLVGNDPSLVSLIGDTEPASSQEALEYCMGAVED